MQGWFNVKKQIKPTVIQQLQNKKEKPTREVRKTADKIKQAFIAKALKTSNTEVLP